MANKDNLVCPRESDYFVSYEQSVFIATTALDVVIPNVYEGIATNVFRQSRPLRIYTFSIEIHAQIVEERTDDAGAAGFGNRLASTKE